MAGEAGAARRGAYICGRCKADPAKIVHHLLDLARSGDRELVAIEGYEIERELDRGGMGAVYLARHAKSGGRVALKVMLPEVAANPIAVGRFLREAHLTRALRHRNVVQLYDAGCSEGTFFLTMQFCDGGSVMQHMKAQGRALPIDEAANVILDVLAGLEYAHAQQVTVKLPDGTEATAAGLVHRDLKPQNIFLTGAGAGRVARIGDYGLAKAFDLAGLSGQTATGAAAGTPSFMPRQQLVNFKYARPEVDVWAAAATFYYLLTGRTPREFPKGQDPWQIVLREPAVPIRQRLPAIPERLAAVIDEALIDQPEIRIQTVADLRRALEAAL
ncbi:MAG: serine/threonine-protein kinase [Gemmataceae bacterium]